MDALSFLISDISVTLLETNDGSEINNIVKNDQSYRRWENISVHQTDWLLSDLKDSMSQVWNKLITQGRDRRNIFKDKLPGFCHTKTQTEK